MPKHELGHAKNMSNFDELLTYVVGYGATYNPSSSSLIDLPALQALQPNVIDAMSTVNRLIGVFGTAKAARSTVFTPLSKLITTIVNIEQTCNANKQNDEQVKSLVRLFRGTHSKVLASTTPIVAAPSNTGTATTTSNPSAVSTARTHSTSQKGFDTMLDTFDKLIELLITIPQYQPNEPSLTTAGLRTLYTTLKANNTAVVSAHVELSNAKLARFTICYTPMVGMVDRCLDVKKYVKAIYGTTSAQYKQISTLTFRNYPLF
jgi:hypothetical protein